VVMDFIDSVNPTTSGIRFSEKYLEAEIIK
jgi:hypothetical protein